MKAVIQEETTGCGIAAVANILGKNYSEIKTTANAMGVFSEDQRLWSDTQYVRKILAKFAISTSPIEVPFETWEKLPHLALLAIKHHFQGKKAFWHWVVFKRINARAFVLDSASYLKSNVRQDFEAMQPKWFIEIHHAK